METQPKDIEKYLVSQDTSLLHELHELLISF